MIRYNKLLNNTLSLLQEVLAVQTYTAGVISKSPHAFNGRPFDFRYEDGELHFETSTIVPTGLQTHDEIAVRRESEVKFERPGLSLYVKGKYLLVNRIAFHDGDADDFRKLLAGTFTSVSTRPYRYYKTERFYRLLLPLEERFRNFGDFIGWHYTVDSKGQGETLMDLVINSIHFHFYPFTRDGQQYLAVDAQGKMEKTAFLAHANAILLAYAFLKGKYFGKQGFVFSYQDTNFDVPASLDTMLMGGGIYNGLHIHTTNPYSVLAQNRDTKYKKDATGRVIGLDDSGYKKYIVEFPSEPFENLPK